MNEKWRGKQICQIYSANDPKAAEYQALRDDKDNPIHSCKTICSTVKRRITPKNQPIQAKEIVPAEGTAIRGT